MNSAQTNNEQTFNPQRILVFRMGQLGDTIVALPSMWVIREQFSNAELTLLCDQHPGKKYVLAADLLRGTGIFDRFESYDVDENSGKLRRMNQMLRLLFRLRRHRYDTLVYLAPSIRTPDQVARDRRFFSLAGIKTFIGMNAFPELPKKIPGQPLASTPSEADLLLARLAADGLPIPAPGQGSLDLNLGPADHAEVDTWLAKESARYQSSFALSSLSPNTMATHDPANKCCQTGHCVGGEGQGEGGTISSPSGRGQGEGPWIGIGPGSKMPAKRWPEERFAQVVANLIDEYDVWPVVFGGSEDTVLCDRLLDHWGRGYNAAGALSVRGAAAGLARCVAYVGNDTGTMHLAAAVKTPCIAIFSARHAAGSWSPYGEGHRVFQVQIECEGCLLTECIEKQNECLSRITVNQITSACCEVLQQCVSAIAHDSAPSFTSK